MISPLSKYSDARRSLHFKFPTFSPPPTTGFVGSSYGESTTMSPSPTPLNNFGNMMMFQDLRWSTAEPPLYPLIEDSGPTEMPGQSHQQSKNPSNKILLF